MRRFEDFSSKRKKKIKMAAKDEKAGAIRLLIENREAVVNVWRQYSIRTRLFTLVSGILWLVCLTSPILPRFETASPAPRPNSVRPAPIYMSERCGWLSRIFLQCGRIDKKGEPRTITFGGEVVNVPAEFIGSDFSLWLSYIERDGFVSLQRADSIFMASKEETVEVGRHLIDITKIRTIDRNSSRAEISVYVIDDTLTWELGGDEGFEIAQGYSADLRRLLEESDVRAALETANHVAGLGLSSSYANDPSENAQLSVRRANSLWLLLKQWRLVNTNRQALWSVPLGYSLVAAQKGTRREREQRRVVIVGLESVSE